MGCGTRPAAAAVLGISPAVEPSLPGSPMRTSNRSVCPPCSKRVSATSRTAVYGPVRTVVWEGRGREAPPYPDRHGTQLDRGGQLNTYVRIEGRSGRLTLESLVDRAALLVSEQLECVCQRDELIVAAAFFSENFAGTVSVFAGAPGTAKAPLTNTELSAGLSLGACELGSSLPILPDGVCCAFSCCCCCCGSAGGDCWAAAFPTAPQSVKTRTALVRTSSGRILLLSCRQLRGRRNMLRAVRFAPAPLPIVI